MSMSIYIYAIQNRARVIVLDCSPATLGFSLPLLHIFCEDYHPKRFIVFGREPTKNTNGGDRGEKKILSPLEE